MSKFFNKVSFDEEEKKLYKELEELSPGASPSEIGFKYEEEKVKEAIKRIKEEVGLISSGQSKLTRAAIEMPASLPCMVALGRFEATPTPSHLNIFLSLTNQDLPRGVYSAFKEWTENLFEEVSHG